MPCPKCNSDNIQTLAARHHFRRALPKQLYLGAMQRRRRECKDCLHRWATLEIAEEALEQYVDIVRQTNATYQKVMAKRAQNTP
jgi:transcriptional regulator NrdR family protein